MKIYDDANFQLNIVKKIAIRYLENPISHEFVERTKEDQGIVLEISPNTIQLGIKVSGRLYLINSRQWV